MVKINTHKHEKFVSLHRFCSIVNFLYEIVFIIFSKLYISFYIYYHFIISSNIFFTKHAIFPLSFELRFSKYWVGYNKYFLSNLKITWKHEEKQKHNFTKNSFTVPNISALLKTEKKCKRFWTNLNQALEFFVLHKPIC